MKSDEVIKQSPKNIENSKEKESINKTVEPDTSDADEIFDKLIDSGYKLLGQGADATVWLKDSDPGVVKIIMPSDGQGAGDGGETFHRFYKLCTSRKYKHLENLPKFITLRKFDLPGEIKDKQYTVVGMEKLNEIPHGSFEEAMTWILSDMATKNLSWNKAQRAIKRSSTWVHLDDSAMNVSDVINIIHSWDYRDKLKWGVLYTLMKVLYHTGIVNKQDWDLHTENVMMRDDGTLVIIDPWIN